MLTLIQMNPMLTIMTSMQVSKLQNEQVLLQERLSETDSPTTTFNGKDIFFGLTEHESIISKGKMMFINSVLTK